MQLKSLANFTGITFIILGLLSICYPLYSSLGIEIFFGALFLFGGIFQLFGTFEDKNRPDYILSFVIGVFYILAGVYLLGNPIGGLLSLTMVLIILFYIQGALVILSGFQHRKTFPQWGWLIFNGILTIVIATILLLSYPMSALWALGILVGINLLTFGISILLINRMIGKI